MEHGCTGWTGYKTENVEVLPGSKQGSLKVTNPLKRAEQGNPREMNRQDAKAAKAKEVLRTHKKRAEQRQKDAANPLRACESKQSGLARPAEGAEQALSPWRPWRLGGLILPNCLSRTPKSERIKDKKTQRTDKKRKDQIQSGWQSLLLAPVPKKAPLPKVLACRGKNLGSKGVEGPAEAKIWGQRGSKGPFEAKK